MGVSDTCREPAQDTESDLPFTDIIPCQNIRLGDFLILEGRACQVLRISITVATGQYRYFGIDLFTKRFHEELSFIPDSSSDASNQYMLAPTFEIYHVLYMLEDRLVIETRTGQVKKGIPVIDQSNLYENLRDALESDPGSISVLALIGTDGRELIVEMRIETDAGGSELHFAARRGDLSRVKDIVDSISDINQLDNLKRTALFGAVESRHEDVVSTLLDKGIDIDAVDSQGRSALDVAILIPQCWQIANLLMKRGAWQTSELHRRTADLLSAAARGEVDETKRLLASTNSTTNESASGMEDNRQRDCDRLGFTALHEAARFGHYKVVGLLIEQNANVNAVAVFGGQTVLHAIVDRTQKYRQYLTNGRDKTPLLLKSHIQIVSLLLQKGIRTTTRSADKDTVQELIVKVLRHSPNTLTTEKCVLQHILVMLVNRLKPLGEPNRGLSNFVKARCNLFKLRIQYQPLADNPMVKFLPVGKFMYDTTNVDGIPDALWQLENYLDRKRTVGGWKWLHLPLNNKKWVKDTINHLSRLDGYASEAYSRAMGAFIDASYHEFRGQDGSVRRRRPQFTPLLASVKNIFSLVLPYFETEELGCSSTEPCHACRSKRDFNNREILLNAYRGLGYKSENFHEPCTLDQSYHMSKDNSKHHNQSQVVVKYAEKDPYTMKSLLMVNEMWLWMADSETIITAFPDRQHQGDKPNLLERISESTDDPTLDLDLKIIQILRCTIDSVGKPIHDGHNANIFDIFERSIAKWSNTESTQYQRFHEIQQQLRDPGQAEHLTDNEKASLEQRMCDIFVEVEAIHETKDIQDELWMIERVLQDQHSVIEQYITHQSHSSSGRTAREALIKDIKGHIQKVERLSKIASSIRESLNDLVNIKQKQANLNVARDTRRLADQAESRAQEGEWHTKLLFVFTVITVIFTPISFICTFLAVPSQDFPITDGDNSNVSWTWWQILAIGLGTEFVVLIGIILYWGFKKVKLKV